MTGVHAAYDRGLKGLEERRALPTLIYHYCDANALLGILQNRQVWATDTNYLNDADELASLFKNVVGHLAAKRTKGSEFLIEQFQKISATAATFRRGLIGLGVYVACFSEDGDVLSQWRAYAADGMGFAIGFDPSRFRVLKEDREASPKRMIYGGSVEERIVTKYFSDFASALAPFANRLQTFGWPEMSFDSWLQLRISEFLHEVAFECKHPAFHEEQEWRIIALQGEVRYRASANRLVPYRVLDMTSAQNEKLMPIEEIVIGPCAPAMESERVLTYLADSLGYGHAGIRFRRSNAPYRK
ncbi:DUF2971 domain-containing protein [Bradyrhizobium sp. 40]|uniref:DUF2971 domain-containing protein n=1 Tax=Bradyrhizobium sp. 40 TaxID=2782674 RepID=UPI001FFF7060|nr:DUF2971 domain-containing protein [Bradyrhizobium sp. 40]UPJ39776.1 DUF2971 domain-containing protein [Bradyrhizobium sp. 40]